MIAQCSTELRRRYVVQRRLPSGDRYEGAAQAPSPVGSLWSVRHFFFKLFLVVVKRIKHFRIIIWFAVNIVSSQLTFDMFLITVLLRKFESTRVEQLLKAKPSRRCGTDRGGQKFYSELCYTSVLHLPLSSQLRRVQDGNLPRCLPCRHAKGHIHPRFSRTLS